VGKVEEILKGYFNQDGKSFTEIFCLSKYFWILTYVVVSYVIAVLLQLTIHASCVLRVGFEIQIVLLANKIPLFLCQK